MEAPPAAEARAKAAKLHAGNLLKEALQVLGGSGGGGPEMAQGQGLDRGRAAEALVAARASVARALLPG